MLKDVFGILACIFNIETISYIFLAIICILFTAPVKIQNTNKDVAADIT